MLPTLHLLCKVKGLFRFRVKNLLGALHTLQCALTIRVVVISVSVNVFDTQRISEVTDLCYPSALLAATLVLTPAEVKREIRVHTSPLCFEEEGCLFPALGISVSTQRVTEAYVPDGFVHRVCACFTYSFCVKSFAEQTLTMDFLYTKGLPHSKIIRMQPQAWPSASVNSLTSFPMST